MTLMRHRRRDVLWAVPNALLPLAVAADLVWPRLDDVLLLPALALVAAIPFVATAFGAGRRAYVALVLSGLAALALSVFLMTLRPEWAGDDGLGRAFTFLFAQIAAVFYVAEVLLCAAVRALVRKLRRQPSAR